MARAGAANEESADEAEDDLELDEDADAAAAENDRRTSVKRSFLAKRLSPLLGYGSTFELVQFVFDLNLWATLGAKKNLGFDNVPMRVLMKGHTFSPLYWREVHSALVDLVRQVGLPKLFFTIAPWEPSFKYHEWLQDEMRKTLRSRMNLLVGERCSRSCEASWRATTSRPGAAQTGSGAGTSFRPRTPLASPPE